MICAAEAAVDAWLSCKPQGHLLDESRLLSLLPLIASKVPHTSPGCRTRELAELFCDQDGGPPPFVTLLKFHSGKVHFLNFWKAFGKAVHLSEASSEEALFTELEILRDGILRALELESSRYETPHLAAISTSILLEEVHRAATMSAHPVFWRDIASSLSRQLQLTELHIEQLSSLLLLWLNDCAKFGQMSALSQVSSQKADLVSQSQCFNPFTDPWDITSRLGSLATSTLSSRPSRPAVDHCARKGHMVYIHVYDVSQEEGIQKLNRILAPRGVPKLGGVFHAGVEVNGLEWSFAYQPHVTRSGVSCDPPRTHSQHHYRQTVKLGLTEFESEEISEIISCLVEEYPGDDYDLLRRNCCHFADDFCQRLGVGQIPRWIHRLARIGAGVATMLEAAQSVRHRVSNLQRSFSKNLQEVEFQPTKETLANMRETEWVTE